MLSWSPEGRERRRRQERKWERKLERVMKQKILTPEDAVNRKIWRKGTEKQHPV
jgi:hypothetical protein